jgi:transketolase
MTTETSTGVDDLCINTVRVLAIDAVEQAKVGHPGTPMGAAAMAYALWDRTLRHDPADPSWPDRDRFVLSAGHASMLLYALLHLTGYDLPLEELKRFRQWGSKTPGHPELGVTPGVETTTGPLGQGFANGVGMAFAERWLAERYNRPGHEIIDHRVYAIVSDGDLEEGVASEAASFAGAHHLGKLIYLYDSNGISIEGDVSVTFNEDTGARFRAYGWHVVGPIDGLAAGEVESALREAQAETSRPSLVICKTIIGYGSPNKANTGEVHGAALGPEEAKLTKANLGWPHEEPFTIPGPALAHFREALPRGQGWSSDWRVRLAAYTAEYPAEAVQLALDLSGDLPDGWASELAHLFDADAAEGKAMATRIASSRTMNAIAQRIHSFVGGSADLAPSTNTLIASRGDFGFESSNVNMHFGIREHAMGAIANGMAVHGGLIPYTATFLAFYDYMRPAVRLAALMEQRVVFVFTHDSIGLGEDGPTHQPIEQVMSARLVPNLVLLRPADATETAAAWQVALERRTGPTVLALSRQSLPTLDRSIYPPAANVAYGAYTLWESGLDPQVIVIGTGSEVPIALQGARLAAGQGLSVRVVSMPSWELFAAQPQAYRDTVLPPSITARVSIEAGVTLGWERHVGSHGVSIGIDRFGASAPIADLHRELGFTAEHVANALASVVSG